MKQPQVEFLDDDDKSFMDKHELRAELLKESRASRPFCAWDGEGITYEPGTPQSYVLFGNSEGMEISAPELSTVDCLELLIRAKIHHPEHIHVIFSGTYDANMILKDVPLKLLRVLRKEGTIRWGRYRISMRPGKQFMVGRMVHLPGEEARWVSIKMYDVFGFFQQSFIKAVENSKIPLSQQEKDVLTAGKAGRRDFTFDELQTRIMPYMRVELSLLVRVMDDLRKHTLDANLRPSGWDGAGALAQALLKREHIKHALAVAPPEVNNAAQYAYAGGRFELFRAGYAENVYGYDINSAYPDAIRHLPNLNRGEWEHVTRYEPARFAVWRIRFDAPIGFELLPASMPFPFFHRDDHGRISYPSRVNGWVWSPELFNVSPRMVADIVYEGWVFRPDDDSRPFEFVPQLYDERRALKARGIGAEKPIKLALNSMYGKLAQRVGYSQSGKIPAYHQLEMAGWVTSYARAKLFKAVEQAYRKGGLIATETDAVYSTVPLDLPIGSGLGQWEQSFYPFMLYWQNGVRWYFDTDSNSVKAAIRGLDKDSLPYDYAYNSLPRVLEEARPILSGKTTRFQGMGLALMGQGRWREWITADRHVAFGGDKRVHIPDMCAACQSHSAYDLHDLIVVMRGGDSTKHKLPWKDGEVNEFAEREEEDAWS